MEKIPYLDFFRLREAPFAITPDPEFLFLSRTHRTVIDTICHGIRTGAGFLLLTGEVGTGKTLVTRIIISRLAVDASVVSIINPSLSGAELVEAILDDLGVGHPAGATKKTLICLLNEFLLGGSPERPTVIIIDDAQTMPPESLEDLRLLSNLETDKKKLLQVLLVGHPELLDRISTPELRQLKQRITVHGHLDYLRRLETRHYIQRRLFVAGNQGDLSFGYWAASFVHVAAHGIPRNINKICDYSLMAGFIGDASAISVAHVRRACGDLRHILPVPGAVQQKTKRRRYLLVACLALVVVVLLLLYSSARRFGGVSLEPARPLPAAIKKPQAGEVIDSPAAAPSLAGRAPVPLVPAGGTSRADGKKSEPAVVSSPVVAPDADASRQPLPAFTVQLASVSSEQEAQDEAQRFGKMGIVAHQQKKGRWFRLLAGRFATRAQARAAAVARGIADPVIYFTEDARLAAAADFPLQQGQP